MYILAVGVFNSFDSVGDSEPNSFNQIECTLAVAANDCNKKSTVLA